MPISFTPYNQALKKFVNQEVTLSTLNVMLRNGTTFTASQTLVTDLDGSEVSGNGWTAGGETIANVAVTIAGTNGAKVDGDNIVVTATGGDIGPFDDLVLLDTTPATDELLGFIALDSAQTAGQNTELRIEWDATDGIIDFNVV